MLLRFLTNGGHQKQKQDIILRLREGEFSSPQSECVGEDMLTRIPTSWSLAPLGKFSCLRCAHFKNQLVFTSSHESVHLQEVKTNYTIEPATTIRLSLRQICLSESAHEAPGRRCLSIYIRRDGTMTPLAEFGNCRFLPSFFLNYSGQTFKVWRRKAGWNSSSHFVCILLSVHTYIFCTCLQQFWVSLNVEVLDQTSPFWFYQLCSTRLTHLP